MLPDRCSVKIEGKGCLSPPEFVISIVSSDGEYMVGVTCNKCKEAVSGKLGILQNEGKIPKGKINFSDLKPVGTDCVKGNADDLIQL